MSARDNNGHRWSGWPGAYCMYCFHEDVREICLADGHDLDCAECKNLSCQVVNTIKDDMDKMYDAPPPDVGDRIALPPQP